MEKTGLALILLAITKHLILPAVFTIQLFGFPGIPFIFSRHDRYGQRRKQLLLPAFLSILNLIFLTIRKKISIMYAFSTKLVSHVLNAISNHGKSCFFCLFATTIFIITYRSYGRKQKRIKPCKNITEVLFFMDDSFYRSSIKKNDDGIANLKKLVDYLDSAKVSLDVCVFTITSHKLGEVILKKFREGLKVRIITDDSMAYGDGSQIPKFRREGIMVRVRRSESLMHHKFAVIDKELLINGSFNWTEQASFGNWENVCITSVPSHLVKSFADHFQILWTKLNGED